MYTAVINTAAYLRLFHTPVSAKVPIEYLLKSANDSRQSTKFSVLHGTRRQQSRELAVRPYQTRILNLNLNLVIHQ
eukprot:SAG31_NODE_23828_length_494_cov_2.546835_2_plen_75_part_01